MNRGVPILFLLASFLPTASFSDLQESWSSESTISTIVEPEQLSAVEKKLMELSSRFPDTQLQKRLTGNGSTRMLFNHQGLPLKIIAFDSGEFEVRWTRNFSADDIDELADTYPELLKYAIAFPKTAGDSTKVKLTIETEITLNASHEREFENEHPQLCEIYRAFKTAPLKSFDSDLLIRVASAKRF